MKKKLVISLLLLFFLFSAGAVGSMLYINKTTSDLESLVNLHRIEIIRQDLVINVHTVQRHLYTIGTEFGKELDVIVESVTDLDNSVQSCIGCHHSKEISVKIEDIRNLVEQYKEALSYFITTTANPERAKRLQAVGAEIGSSLLSKSQEMAFIADQRLNDRTIKAMRDIKNSEFILFLTLILAFLFAVVIAVALTKGITEPITELVSATRKVKAGELGYTSVYKGKDEFGELINAFNDMSLSLKESNEKIMLHLNRLAGLYRVTLPLHSVSNITEIFREVSYGVADLIDVEECGLLLLDKESTYFEHKYPAFGLDEMQINSIRIHKEDLLKLFFSNSRRPVIINNLQTESLPARLLGGNNLNVRNIMLGWVRQKGELIGVIRLANKKEGDFLEESSRLIGIISNNVSVAIENIKLYEDLKAQMQELKETQAQLVQAAKLAAIGELASNVAHEINNPLTSIMGYTELIREETDIGNIMKDIDIIEKESMRARDIVQQLLEFSRKKPLEINKIDINSLINESVSLINVQIKDARIKIIEEYSELPLIMGDSNQLKQVFLNIIKNSVDAMSDKGGELSIRTAKNGTNVIVEICDSGRGIPSEVLSRVFEPFFTTKRDKGTGLGLSITYKIIQSHKGKIDVKSEEGKGTKFTVSLPVHI